MILTVFRCASIPSSDDRYSLTDSEIGNGQSFTTPGFIIDIEIESELNE